MKIGHLEIIADDPSLLADFYKDSLGFELTVVQGNRFYWLLKGNLELLIKPYPASNDTDRSKQAKHQLVFYSDEIESDIQILCNKGVEVILGSDNCAHFVDPEGNPLQIVDPGEGHSG